MGLNANVTDLVEGAAPSYSLYPDIVPEAASIPAMALTCVSPDLYSRPLEGEKTGKHSVWRVAIVTESISDMEIIIDLLLELDNTSNDNFQRIFAEVVNREAKGQDEPYRRAFVEITVYN